MGIDELAGGAPGTDIDDPVPQLAYGRVTRAPATADDSMTVTLTALGGDHPFTVQPGHWAPRGSALPTVGTRCLVTFDDRDDAWVPVWSHMGGA